MQAFPEKHRRLGLGGDADDDDAAPVASGQDRGVDRSRLARSVEDDMSALAGRIHHGVDHGIRGYIHDHVGAQLLGSFQAVWHAIGADDLGGPGKLGDLNRQQPDRAGAHDGDGVAHPQVRQRGRVQQHRRRLDDRGRAEVQVNRNFQRIAHRDRGVLAQ